MKQQAVTLDVTDRAIVNGLQGGFPLSEEPFADAAGAFGIDGHELMKRIDRMLENGTLSRFGPMYHAEKMGGGLTLAAMKVPQTDFERIAAIVNGFAEVAHNYARDHAFNMWFVIATETPGGIEEIISEIEAATGHKVHNMPKIDEFFIGLKLEA